MGRDNKWEWFWKLHPGLFSFPRWKGSQWFVCLNPVCFLKDFFSFYPPFFTAKAQRHEGALVPLGYFFSYIFGNLTPNLF
jgi:hypothetical protein